MILADDGISALRILDSDKFNVLITDIKMPSMDGIELFNRVKNYILKCMWYF